MSKTSTYTTQFINDTPPQLMDNDFYADYRYDNSDTNNVYIGCNILYGISTSDASWKIYKIFYNNGVFYRVGIQYGSWDNRTSLF